jgi:hypothetical protein
MNKKILFFTMYLFCILPAVAHSYTLQGESIFRTEEYNFRDDISFDEIVIGLAYGFPKVGPFTLASIIEGSDPFIGFDNFVNGEKGVYDYNFSNSPFYESFVQKLTDNKADLMVSVGMYPNVIEPVWLYGVYYSGSSDSTFFGPSLVGQHIDFFRLAINELIIERQDPDGYIRGYGDLAIHTKADFTWQVWGSDNIDPTPVPVPTTMLLLGSGIVGLIGSRFRKKKK